ncbi:MAG: hypothetical protein ABIF12_02545 [bacterium]
MNIYKIINEVLAGLKSVVSREITSKHSSAACLAEATKSEGGDLSPRFSAKTDKLKIIFFSLFLLPGSSFAEYILVKDTDKGVKPPSFEEYQSAIDIVYNWSFPMSLRNLQMLYELKQSDLNRLCNDEKQFIQDKLREAGLDLRLIFIPNIMYELMLVTNKKSYDFIREKKSSIESFSMDKDTGDYIFDDTVEINKQFNSMKYFNDFEFFDRDVYFRINNFILNLLLKFSDSFDIYDLHDFFNKYILFLGDQGAVLKFTDPLDENSNDFYCHRRRIVDHLANEYKNKLFRSNLFALESMAYQNGFLPLYRGTSGFEPNLDSLRTKVKGLNGFDFAEYGISYGNTLFAGLFIDDDACTYNYIFDLELLSDATFTIYEKDQNYGYSLFISKLDYIKSKLNSGSDGIYDLIFIPPISVLNGLFSFGELFHSRVLQFDSSDELLVNKKVEMFHKYLDANSLIFFGAKKFPTNYKPDGNYVLKLCADFEEGFFTYLKDKNRNKRFSKMRPEPENAFKH